MTMVEEMILSGFISKIVSDVVDIPENPIKNVIRNADKKRRDKNQSIETRIYQVTIDAIKEFTKREYKRQDVLYDAAESILKGFIRNKDDKTEAVRAGLKMLVSPVTSETCKEFLKILHHEICIDKNDILYREIILLQGEQTFETVCEGFDVSNRNDEETHRKLDYAIEGINNIDKRIDGIEKCETKHREIPVENRAGEYAQKWDKNVFLNDFNKRDKNAGVNIKLKDIYLEDLLPHYKWKPDGKEENDKELKDGNQEDLKELLSEYIVDNDEKKMLLILGQPGIGKSTLITWIMANLVEKSEQVLIYQFANDLNSIDWKSKNVLNDIFSVIGLKYDNLENKTLVLDGFDEIHTDSDRERILNKLNQELKRLNAVRSFSVIITCRENYIYNLQNINCDYIVLQVWDETQIGIFCRAYWEKCGNESSKDKIQKILENKEIFGIPLILYMILALDITIEKSGSIVDVYDQIFSLKQGGIYDRCYAAEHRINEPETKKYIHRITQKIAFWIFENNADEAFIYQKNFKEICDIVMLEAEDKSEGIQSNTLIGNYFKVKHCEGQMADEVNFIHRSIYEYFVVVYFFESIHELKTKEEVAGKLGELLKEGRLSEQMLEFIKYKFDGMKGYSLPDITKNTFNIMLQYGMTYYSKEKYKNTIKQERNIFSNVLEIVGLWNTTVGEVDDKIATYLQCNRDSKLNLKGIRLSVKNFDLKNQDLRGVYLSKANLMGADLSRLDLRRVHLNGADLREANLSGVDLSRSDLIGVHLYGANLKEADLSKADLRYADLRKVNLKEAVLREANLSRANLIGADLSGANLEGAYLNMTLFSEKQVKMLCSRKYDLNLSDVLISETDERISCEEYCISRQND